MNPINAINQEFARRVVEQWSDEAAIRQQEQGADESRVGITTAIRALVRWVRARIDRLQPAIEPTLRHAPSKQ
jgi:hypothetical protein